MTYQSTAYLLVILDEHGNRKDIGIYSEAHPTMRFADTSAVIMTETGEHYGHARDRLLDRLRAMYGHRDWILRELGEEVAS